MSLRPGKMGLRCLVAALAAGALGAAEAAAAPGDLDPTFGNGGKRTLALPKAKVGIARAVAQQSDGKIVVAGEHWSGPGGIDFALARFHRDGSLDRSFGSDGIVRTDTGITSGYGATAVAIQADGKIVVAGEVEGKGSSDFGVVRYLPNGALDGGFGLSGDGFPAGTATNLRTNAQSVDVAQGLVLQDGKIVVAGHTTAPFGSRNFALARYTSVGAPDPSFSDQTAGALTTTPGTVAADLQGDDFAYGLTLLADGRLAAVGAYTKGASYSGAVAAFEADGDRDLGFGASGSGWARVDFQALQTELHAAAEQPDGRLVVAGESRDGFAVGRLSAAGSLDGSFSGDGLKLTSFGAGAFASAREVLIQPDGRILVAGDHDRKAFAVARYTAAGALDSSFGGDGRVTTSLGAGDDRGRAFLLAPTGELLGAGLARGVRTSCTSTRFCVDEGRVGLVRYLTGGEQKCAGRRVTLTGTGTIVGTPGADVIRTGAGGQTIKAKGGNDVVCAGNGTDIVAGGAGKDRLVGQGGADKLRGGKGGDTLSGGPGNDRCNGGPGRDRAKGCEFEQSIP